MKIPRRYSDIKEVYPVFEAISLCYPNAKEYVHKIKEYSTSWRVVLSQILENEDQYKNAKEMVELIKVSCPVLFDNSDHEEFIEQLEKCVYIERLYGNTKDSVMQLVRNYVISVC